MGRAKLLGAEEAIPHKAIDDEKVDLAHIACNLKSIKVVSASCFKSHFPIIDLIEDIAEPSANPSLILIGEESTLHEIGGGGISTIVGKNLRAEKKCDGK